MPAPLSPSDCHSSCRARPLQVPVGKGLAATKNLLWAMMHPRATLAHLIAGNDALRNALGAVLPVAADYIDAALWSLPTT